MMSTDQCELPKIAAGTEVHPFAVNISDSACDESLAQSVQEGANHSAITTNIPPNGEDNLSIEIGENGLAGKNLSKRALKRVPY